MRVQVSGSIYHIGGKDLHVYIGNQIKASHFVLSLRQYTLQMLNMMTEKPHSDTVCNYTLNRGQLFLLISLCFTGPYVIRQGNVQWE